MVSMMKMKAWIPIPPFHARLKLPLARWIRALAWGGVTPSLFARYPDAAAFAQAVPAELEEAIRTTGFFRNKTRNIRACCENIVARHGGEVPGTLEDVHLARRGDLVEAGARPVVGGKNQPILDFDAKPITHRGPNPISAAPMRQVSCIRPPFFR